MVSTQLKLKEEFEIRNIISVNYLELARVFSLKGEMHDFWEFYYVDKGEIRVGIDDEIYNVLQGEMILCRPNEFHNILANDSSSNIIMIAFECKSKAMDYLDKKVYCLKKNEVNLIAEIFRSSFRGSATFFLSSNQIYSSGLDGIADPFFGCEQYIKINLELLLLTLVNRKNIYSETELSSPSKERNEDSIVERIIEYMHDNIRLNLVLEDICKFSNLGKTYLESIFKRKTGLGVIEYFKRLKISQAKLLIRNENYNLSEISDLLDFSSISCFTRYFKQIEQMTPSEYAKSIKARINC
ncbi:MAG: helix-turn-helix transcriptional regulator [Ruminiclostridium sp.]|nr:helix-turn-helix transcriptional regulator [Ruminiclostridium sp.]